LVLIKQIVFQIFRPILTIFIEILKIRRFILFSLFFYLNVILQIVHSIFFLNVQVPKKLATDNFPPILFRFLVWRALTIENKMYDTTSGDGELLHSCSWIRIDGARLGVLLPVDGEDAAAKVSL